jgi:hypothetical protein
MFNEVRIHQGKFLEQWHAFESWTYKAKAAIQSDARSLDSHSTETEIYGHFISMISTARVALRPPTVVLWRIMPPSRKSISSRNFTILGAIQFDDVFSEHSPTTN